MLLFELLHIDVRLIRREIDADVLLFLSTNHSLMKRIFVFAKTNTVKKAMTSTAITAIRIIRTFFMTNLPLRLINSIYIKYTFIYIKNQYLRYKYDEINNQKNFKKIENVIVFVVILL